MADPTATPARVAPASVGPAAGAAAIVTWHEGAAYVWGWDGVHTMASPWLYRAFRCALAGLARRRRVHVLARRPHARGPRAAPDGAAPRPPARATLARAHRRSTRRLATADGGSRRRPHERHHGLVRHRRPTRRGRRVGWARRADHRAAGARRRVRPARRRPLAAGARCCVRCRGGDAAGEQAADRRHRARCDRSSDRGRPRRRCRPMAAARRRVVGRPARDRSTVTVAARSVFKSLTGHDRRLDLPRAVRHEDIDAIGRRFHRTGQRAAGRNVVERRVRLVVPEDPLDPWAVVLELVDEADPGRWCTAADVWEGTPLAVEVANGADGLAALGDEVSAFARDVAESVPVARALADQRQPSLVELEVDDAAEFLEQAPEALGRAGIGIIGPEALVRAAVGVRGAASPAPASDRRSGFGRDDRPVVAHGCRRRAHRHLRGRAGPGRADRLDAAAHRPALGRIDPAALRRPGRRLEDYATLTGDDAEHGLSAMDLLHLSADAAAAGDELGVGEEAAAGRTRRGGVVGPPPRRAAGRCPARRARAGRVHRRAAPLPTTRPRVDALPRPDRPRRLPRRRHGAGPDCHRAGAPARSPGPTPRRVPVVGRAQLAERRRPGSPRTLTVTIHHGAQHAGHRHAGDGRRMFAYATSLVITTYGLATREHRPAGRSSTGAR